MKSISILVIVLSLSCSVFAASNRTVTGYPAFQQLQNFLLGTNNWGLSKAGACRFDFQLLPAMNSQDGITVDEELSAIVSLDRSVNETGEGFKDSIGYSELTLEKIDGRTLELLGGSYDGSATLTLTKQNDGTVLITAHWSDKQLGPDRDNTCLLPVIR